MTNFCQSFYSCLYQNSTSLFPNTSVMVFQQSFHVQQSSKFFFFGIPSAHMVLAQSKCWYYQSLPCLGTICYFEIFVMFSKHFWNVLLFEILFGSLWIRNFSTELFTRSAFFLLLAILLPLLHFLCCQTGFSQGGIHPSHPEDCIGLGWAPASTGDSWVSPSNPLQFAYWWRWGTVSQLILWSEIIIFPPSDLTWLYN